MEENNYKPQIPDVMEAIFDAAYLIFDLVAAILFFTFSKGNILFVLYGILTLTLCGGDAFHLVPRIIRAVRGSDEKIKRQLGIGLQVSSVTMTVFYIILMYVWKFTFPEMIIPTIVEAVVWISAVVRIVICMFPQNNWCTDEGNMKLHCQKCCLCGDGDRSDYSVYHFRECEWVWYDKNGCSDHSFFWLLSAGYFIQ